MPVAVIGDEHPGRELLREPLRPDQRGGRVALGADDDDRWRALPVDLRPGHRGERPVQARQPAVGQLRAEGRRLDGQHRREGVEVRDRQRLQPLGVGPAVDAVDGVDRLAPVAPVGTVVAPLGEQVVDVQQHLAVPGQATLQPRPQHRPRVVLVERADQGEQPQALGQRPGVVPRGQRRVLQRRDQAPYLRDAVVDGAAQRAVRLDEAVGHEGLQRHLEPPRLLQRRRGVRRGAPGQVDRAVQHEPADPVGEQLGVHGPEDGAVGLSEEGEVRIAQHGPQHVHVAGGGHRVHERCGPVVGAAGRQPVGQLHEVGELTRLVRAGVGGGEVVVGGVVQAVHAGRARHPARVEADDVVGRAQLLAGDHARLQGVVDPRATGAPGVEDERTEPVPGSRQPGQRQQDRPLTGGGVVQRDLHGGALVVLPGDALRRVDQLTPPPLQLLGVERGEVPARRHHDRRVDRRRR